MVLQNDMPIDFDYYIEKQLKQPLMRILEPILDNPLSLFSGEHTKQRYIPKASKSVVGKFFKVQATCLSCKYNPANIILL